jgi:hypothetical protein
MTSKERLLTAWSFREPDRIPIELHLHPKSYEFQEAERIVEFVEKEADNFHHVPAVDFGFAGLPSEYSEQVIEDVAGKYYRLKRVHDTPAGEFYAITRHNYDEIINSDYRWERRFVDTLEEMERLAEAPREVPSITKKEYEKAVTKLGDRGIPLIELWHPLGFLVRRANLEEVYTWFVTHPRLIHRFLENANTQVAEAVRALCAAGQGPFFSVTAHEMLIPPWMGPDKFDEFVFPYDKAVNDAIHRNGGRLRAHCHGNCMSYLAKMNDMGIDSVEPLEPPPFGDVDLARAKRLVGDRMLLSGNITSNSFPMMSRTEVREQVKRAIETAGRGGGFTLRTTGGEAATNSVKNSEQMVKVLDNIAAYIEAGLEFGSRRR